MNKTNLKNIHSHRCVIHRLRSCSSVSSMLTLVAVILIGSHAGAAGQDYGENQEVKTRRLALQARYADFLEVKLNQDPQAVRFEIVDMRNSMVEFEGKKYCAFRFKTGSKVSRLTWCFRYPPGLRGWYILRQKGTMQGFDTFQNFVLSNDKEGWGSNGDSFAVQLLSSRHFEPNTGYIMWFQITDAADSAINLSLNMTPVPDDALFSAVFSEIKL